MFDTLFYILRGKKDKVKRAAASELVYKSDDESTSVYQLKHELIERIAEIDRVSLEKVALDILKLDETYQAYAAVGIAMPPTEYLKQLHNQCKAAIESKRQFCCVLISNFRFPWVRRFGCPHYREDPQILCGSCLLSNRKRSWVAELRDNRSVFAIPSVPIKPRHLTLRNLHLIALTNFLNSTNNTSVAFI